MTNLWSSNTPSRFWLCKPDPSEAEWLQAIRNALPILELPIPPNDLDNLLQIVLGEGQFGTGHWQLSRAKRAYYVLKPVLPRPLIRILRQFYARCVEPGFPLSWPVEPRYARFQWEIMRQLLLIRGQSSLDFVNFWPRNQCFALVLTHDIETAQGQNHVRSVADLEESLGFRSSFNFIPERYVLDYPLIQELRNRGFEVAVHGLKHDGKEFSSYKEFSRRAPLINEYLSVLDAVGFAAPLTLRQPEWMQALNIEYDRSFFDTDPYEAIAGGVMSIWPYRIGRFVELPYTLAQDYTLTAIQGELTPRIWLNKLEFIKKYHGMALMVTHPDYLRKPSVQALYGEFLQTIKANGSYWHALPRDVARWWQRRDTGAFEGDTASSNMAQAIFQDGDLKIVSASASVSRTLGLLSA